MTFKDNSNKLERTLEQQLQDLLSVLLVGSEPSSGDGSAPAAEPLRPGDLHPLQEERDAQDHRDGSALAAPLHERGPGARSPPHLLPLHRRFAGPQTGSEAAGKHQKKLKKQLTLAMQLDCKGGAVAKSTRSILSGVKQEAVLRPLQGFCDSFTEADATQSLKTADDNKEVIVNLAADRQKGRRR